MDKTVIERAIEWAERDNRYAMDTPNIVLLLRKAKEEYNNPHRHTIMRNQLHIGFDNTLWPVLSRWLIMSQPYLAEKIHPRSVASLDGVDGQKEVLDGFRKVFLSEPKVSYWRDAKEKK